MIGAMYQNIPNKNHLILVKALKMKRHAFQQDNDSKYIVARYKLFSQSPERNPIDNVWRKLMIRTYLHYLKSA